MRMRRANHSEDLRPWEEPIQIEVRGMVWASVHEALRLALKHPELREDGTIGPEFVRTFTARLGVELEKRGLLIVTAECEFCSCTEDSACEGGCVFNADYLEIGRYVCTACKPQTSIVVPGTPEFADTIAALNG